jgi:hypothetical protein
MTGHDDLLPPAETAGAVVTGVLSFTPPAWAVYATFVFGGLTAGIWFDWLLRRIDGSRQKARKDIGLRMIHMGANVINRGGRWPHNVDDYVANLRSTFLHLNGFRIWAPDDRMYQLRDGQSFLANYLRTVGQLLWEDHFDEAKKAALEARTVLEEYH